MLIGGVGERLKPPVLKTGVHFVDREFESRPLRQSGPENDLQEGDPDRAHDSDGIRHGRRMDLVALGTATAVFLVRGRQSSGNTAEKQQESSIKRSTGMTNVHQKVRSCLFSCRATGRVGATPP